MYKSNAYENSRMSVASTEAQIHGDRLKELKAFDETRAGVKGLVDAGTATIPDIFIRPPEELEEDSTKFSKISIQVPVIDLGGIRDAGRRQEIIREVMEASEKWGFFQVVNHGIPLEVLEGMIDGVRLFNEQDPDEKKKFYTRDNTKPVRFNTNHDLFMSKFASWRDTLTVSFVKSDVLDPDELPAVCREQTREYLRHVVPLGETLFEVLSEGLGLRGDHLGSLGCGEGFALVSHYYPACPNPELILGANCHSDPGFLTLLLQNHISGLQVLYEGHWVTVDPVPGGVVVNIGDLLQMITNDKLPSIVHRVLANRTGPRISVAYFFSGRVSSSSKSFKPIKELTSEDNPSRYKEIVLSEYVSGFYSRKLEAKSNFDHYRCE